MKRFLLLVLMLSLLNCLPVPASAEYDYTPATGEAAAIIPWGSDLLVCTSERMLHYMKFSKERGIAISCPTMVVDGKTYSKRIPAFSALWGGPDDTIYGAMRTDDACTVYRGELGQSFTIEMSALGEIPLPWDKNDHAAVSYMTCGDGVVAQAGNDLFCWNPDTGATAFWPNCAMYRIFTAGDKLLGVSIIADGRAELLEIHIPSQSTSKVATLNDIPDQIAGSPDGRSVAWLSNSIITGKGDGVAERGGYMGRELPSWPLETCLTNSGLFVVRNKGSVYFEQLEKGFDPNNQGLIIGDYGMSNSAVARFRKNHPDIRVSVRSFSAMGLEYTPAAIADRIRSGDKSIDVFLIDTSDLGYRAMLEKGYCADLSDDAFIADLVTAMPGNIVSALMEDGKVLAVPYNGSIRGVYDLSQRGLEEMGLTAQDVPTNMDELLDAVSLWLQEGRLDNVRLMDMYTESDTFWPYSYALGVWESYHITQGKYLPFDDPAFRRMMAKADALRKQLAQRDWPGAAAPSLFAHSAAYFDQIGSPDSSLIPIVMTPFPNQAPRYLTHLEVAVVNPRSAHKEEAMFFLRSLLNDMPPEAAMYFWPDKAEAVVKAKDMETIQMNEQFFAAWEAKANDASLPADERRKAQEEAELLRHVLDELKQDNWQLSPDEIAAYRAIVPDVYPAASDIMTQIYRSGGLDMEDRYFAGQITIDQLLDHYARIARMIAMEDGVLLP